MVFSSYDNQTKMNFLLQKICEKLIAKLMIVKCEKSVVWTENCFF